MDSLLPYLLDWANMLLRWLHLIVGIAWIGSSFYFVWLDNSLTAPKDEKLKSLGVSGELWAVHGGGFYNPQKYLLAPAELPQNLHWFYWESYSTWLSGFALFCIAYLLSPSIMLVDKNVFEMSAPVAILAALGYLVAGWFVYDAICRLFGVGDDADKKVAVSLILYVGIAAWVACHLFAGRAAFLMTGAMIATIMSANVLVWIIPGQRKVIASMKRGESPDPIHGQCGKQRSVHNTYFTLPVLFAMLSNHYSGLYNAPDNWLVLILVMAGGALIRHFFVSRHKQAPSLTALALGVTLIGIAAWKAAPAPVGITVPTATPTLAQVETIINERCVSCHNAQMASKNIRLDGPDRIQSQLPLIHQQVVVTRLMPINNSTAITEEERLKIDLWFKSQQLKP
jgi:uncharacterized membrane protein